DRRPGSVKRKGSGRTFAKGGSWKRLRLRPRRSPPGTRSARDTAAARRAQRARFSSSMTLRNRCPELRRGICSASPESRHGEHRNAQRPHLGRSKPARYTPRRSVRILGEYTMSAPAPFRRAPRAICFRLERLDDRNLPSVARLLALGADAGGLPQVRLIDPATGQEQSSFLAYDSAFRGGVRVALGDLNGDGIPDI